MKLWIRAHQLEVIKKNNSYDFNNKPLQGYVAVTLTEGHGVLPHFKWKIRNKTSGHEMITKNAYSGFHEDISEDWGCGPFKYTNYEAIEPFNG